MGPYAYFLLFKDNILSNFVFNPSSEFIFHIMKKWDYSKPLILFILIFSSFFIILINYFCGNIIYKIIKYIELKKEKSSILDMHKEFFERYAIIFLSLSFIPFGGKFIECAAGIYRINIKKVLFICIISKTIYYLILLLM